LGNTQTKLERQDEAAESFNEAYHWLKICVDNDSTGKEMIDALTTLENIAIAQLNLQQIDEAEKWVNREDSLLSIFKKSNVADSVEVDFYQALTMLNRARICQERGQEAEAARYYDEYMTSNYGKSAEGRISSCSYLMAARRYTEAAYNFNFLNDFMEGRALEFDLETINDELMPKLRSNYYAGRKDSALQVAVQIAEVYDSALIRQKRSDAAELATIYDTQGKERQIAEQRAGKRLFTTISIATGLVALLILAFAVYVYRQWRATQEKNRILAQQITEAVEYKEKLREEKKKQVAFEEEAVKAGLSISDFTTLTDEQLFLCLRDLIENEQLFLQPDFGRQTLIDRTGLSKECIGAAFAQGSDTNSLPAYVRELRLDYAVRLMNAQPDITIEQVSQASGFSSADTFTRNFRAKFGMTPTAYKQTKISE
jgi:AraC-like DNA-binding protein